MRLLEQSLRDYIRSLNDVPGLLAGTDDVEVIDEALVERMYLHLRDSGLSSGAKKKRWGFWRRFVRYLWQKRLIEIPRNLDGFSFKVQPKRIKTYTPAEVKAVLASLKPRLRLYGLLALNTGMYQTDIAELRRDMVDLETGTLTRKRVKTFANANVPVVCYKLWPETLDLLRQHQSNHPELFLTSMAGTPLLEVRYEGGEVRRKDMVIQQWRRAEVPIPLKSFRAIAASALESHEVYGRYTSYFLGHSPRGVAARHYVQPSAELFAQALDWLHDQFFKG